MRTKITKDGFIWLVVQKNTAIALFKNEDAEVYRLYADDSEGLIENLADFSEHDGEFGVKLGFVKDLYQYRTDKKNNRFGYGLAAIVEDGQEENLGLEECITIHDICHKACSVLTDDELKYLFNVKPGLVIEAIKGYDKIDEIMND